MLPEVMVRRAVRISISMLQVTASRASYLALEIFRWIAAEYQVEMVSDLRCIYPEIVVVHIQCIHVFDSSYIY
jgi:hypothetical protein